METKEKKASEKLPEKTESKIELNQSQESKLQKTEKEKRQQEEPIKPGPEKLASLFVDNESQYSKKFISELRTTKGMEKIELREDMMILNEKDSIAFPEYPRLNQTNILTGKKEDLAIALTVERNSFTSIEYKLEMVEFGKSSKIIKGIAELGVFFFFD